MVQPRLLSGLKVPPSVLKLNSPAKLNLFLAVLNKRKDNYHNIATLFERIDLCDTVILKARPDKKIRVTCSSPGVPNNKSNLAWRAASWLQRRFTVKAGVDITIIKRIPVGAGLGGGSSNAATVLVGLNEIWKLHLANKRLVEIAKTIGSDVPFFIYDRQFAYGYGRGDRIVPIEPSGDVRLWHILVVPKLKVLTPLIYERWDRESVKTPWPLWFNTAGWRRCPKATLTRAGYNVRILRLALSRKDPVLLGSILFNSLEQVTIGLFPEVRRIKEALSRLGVKSILMSGSGPAVFGVVSARKEAASLCGKLKRQDRSWRVFLTHTL